MLLRTIKTRDDDREGDPATALPVTTDMQQQSKMIGMCVIIMCKA